MKALHPLALALALWALAGPANAQQRFTIGGWGDPPRTGAGGGHGHGRHHRQVPIYIEEREVIVEREVVREVPAPAPPPPPAPPPAPRKPFVIGASYASLPVGCMKMIEGGASYFYCAGDWYQQVGAGVSGGGGALGEASSLSFALAVLRTADALFVTSVQSPAAQAGRAGSASLG